MKINLEILNAHCLMASQKIDSLRTKELVPKMVFRRRLTQASKIAVELMHEVGFTTGRIMYASAYGELPATANILKAILNQEGISPTDFQNSVYNTPVSYASILQNNKSEIMTISCGNNTDNRLLKLGAIKAMDKDEILLMGIESMNIEDIEQLNECIDYLECGVALKVRITQKDANMAMGSCRQKVPQSLEKLVSIAQNFDANRTNIIEVEL